MCIWDNRALCIYILYLIYFLKLFAICVLHMLMLWWRYIFSISCSEPVDLECSMYWVREIYRRYRNWAKVETSTAFLLNWLRLTRQCAQKRRKICLIRKFPIIFITGSFSFCLSVYLNSLLHSLLWTRFMPTLLSQTYFMFEMSLMAALNTHSFRCWMQMTAPRL